MQVLFAQQGLWMEMRNIGQVDTAPIGITLNILKRTASTVTARPVYHTSAIKMVTIL